MDGVKEEMDLIHQVFLAFLAAPEMIMVLSPILLTLELGGVLRMMDQRINLEQMKML